MKTLNGSEQTAAMAKLMNTDQRAPAGDQWKPNMLAGFRVGDFVRLPNIDAPLEVIDLADPLLILQSPSGHQLRAGWRACTRIRTRAEIETRLVS